MTEPYAVGLLRGKLARLQTLMSNPPALRPGATYLLGPFTSNTGVPYSYKVDPAWYERIISLYATFTASAAVGSRLLLANLLDGDGNVWNSTPASPPLTAGMSWTISADLGQTQPPFTGTSVDNFGSFTSPGAGQQIVAIALPAGVYTVAWQVQYGGTTSGTEVDNIQLNLAGVLVEAGISGSAAATTYAQQPTTIEVPAGGATVSINASGAGTAASIYRGWLVVTPAAQSLTCPQLPNLQLKPGWSLQLTASGLLAGDQFTGIRILSERYPSNWASGAVLEELEELLELAER